MLLIFLSILVFILGLVGWFLVLRGALPIEENKMGMPMVITGGFLLVTGSFIILFSFY